MKNAQWENQANSTQRLSTLKRHPRANYGGPTQQQYINMLARLRLLEDDILAQKIKSQTLERKSYEYLQTIAHLQYTVGDLRFMLQKSEIESKKHAEIQRQIQTYSSNLREVGQQLAQLNSLVEKKNKECLKLQTTTNKLKDENAHYEQRFKQLVSMRQAQKNKLRQILQQLSSEYEPSFNQELIGDLELISESIAELKDNLAKTKNALEKHRKQNSTALIQQKQKIISLEYALKLAEKRNEDIQKKKAMESQMTIDKKVEDIIQQMLKKQEELITKINELQIKNQDLEQQLQTQKQVHANFTNLKQKDMEKQLKQAKTMIRQLLQEKNQISDRFDQLSHIKDIESSRSLTEQLQTNRKYREFCEQNKRLKLRIAQLESDNKMLQKQLSFRHTQ